MTALRDFEDDLERAIADLEDAIANVAGIDEDAEGDIFIEEDDGATRLDVGELKDLLARLADAPEMATAAFREFDREVTRALRNLKRALVQTAEG